MSDLTLTDGEWLLIAPHVEPFAKQSKLNDRKAVAAMLLADAARISMEDAAEWVGLSVSALRSRKSRLGTGAYRALLTAGAPAGRRLRSAYRDRADDTGTGRLMKLLGFPD